MITRRNKNAHNFRINVSFQSRCHNTSVALLWSREQRKTVPNTQ